MMYHDSCYLSFKASTMGRLSYDIKDTYQVRLTTVPQSSPNYIHHENTEEAAALYLSIIEILHVNRTSFSLFSGEKFFSQFTGNDNVLFGQSIF